MVNYSIIIPHRNLPDLLERALASIPRRSDIEIIVVDDASDPDVVDFSNYPGLDDPSVRLVFTTDRPDSMEHNARNASVVAPRSGSGAGYARNVGLSLAQGRRILFLDCDDFFVPGFLTLLDSHLEDDADIVFFNITSAYSDDLGYSPRHLSRSEYFTAYTASKREFCCRYLYTEPWGKMFRTSFLREGGFRFEETPLANDYRFSIQTGLAAGKVVTDGRELCCITERRGSLSHDFCSTAGQLTVRLSVYHGVQTLLDASGVKAYPFYKLVNFVLRHRRSLLPVLRSFCSTPASVPAAAPSAPSSPSAQGRINFKALKTKTFLLRLLFARYHRRHWAIF